MSFFKPIFRYLRISEFISYYSRVDKKPGLPSILMIIPRVMLSKKPVTIMTLIYRSIVVNRLPAEPSFKDSKKLPEITILIVVEEKDFYLLNKCVSQAIKHSKNKISRVVVVTPKRQVDKCRRVISNIPMKVKPELISEDMIVPVKVRQKLKKEFKDRYGWVLQQFITVGFMLKDEYNLGKPILALDADTFISRNTAWIDNSGTQVLLRSIEYHKPYYELLNKLNKNLIQNRYSFITHHMVFQPQLFKEIFSKLGIPTLEKLAEFVIKNYSRYEKSPICVEFEIYAQYLNTYRKEKIELLKFSNISIKRNKLQLIGNEEKLAEEYSNYKSISMHSYYD